MRIIQRNVLQSIGAAVTSGIRLWKATAPTALHSDYAPERPERRSRMWAAGSRGSGSSELGIPPEISIYSDSGWDSSEPNVLLEECNYNEGPSSNITLDVHASVFNTDGQLRDILSDMEPIDTDDQVRNTLSDVEPIDMEYLLEDNQRVVNFLAAVTQEDKQRFIGLLEAKIDQEWEAQKAVAETCRMPRRPDIYTYVERLGINSSLVRQHYELPLPMGTSSRKKKSRHGITIRKNKHSVSTAEGSSSHLNRTESSQ